MAGKTTSNIEDLMLEVLERLERIEKRIDDEGGRREPIRLERAGWRATITDTQSPVCRWNHPRRPDKETVTDEVVFPERMERSVKYPAVVQKVVTPAAMPLTLAEAVELQDLWEQQANGEKKAVVSSPG